MQNRKKGVWIPFLLPSFLGAAVFVCLPLLDVVRRSFTTAVTGKWTGLSNYRTVFSNQAFRLAAANTLRFTLVCLPLLLGLALFLAVQLAKLKKIQFLKSCLLFPMAMPAASVVLVWKMAFSEVIYSDGAFWVLVFSYLWKNLGYTIVLMLTGLLAIPAEILEAARVDGATKLQCFWRIVFPNLKGCLYTVTVLSFLNSFKVFREAYLVAGSYPHESMYLLQHLFNNWFVNLDLDKMAAAAVCVGIVLLGAILLLERLWDREE